MAQLACAVSYLYTCLPVYADVLRLADVLRPSLPVYLSSACRQEVMSRLLYQKWFQIEEDRNIEKEKRNVKEDHVRRRTHRIARRSRGLRRSDAHTRSAAAGDHGPRRHHRAHDGTDSSRDDRPD